MLGEKLYTLRKNRNISQEEFADILNTSRQAISKWERNEARPDIDKLITIAKFFNVSIDYLLSYEINYSNADDFLNKLKDCYLNNNFTININDIKLWCSKYANNFKLYVYSADYLFVAFINNNKKEYLDEALSCVNKAIAIYTPEDNDIISLNDLHISVAYIYFMQHKYELAKEYIKNNSVNGCEVIVAKCELALEAYEKALETSSKIYIESASNILNVNLIQARVLLKNKTINDAYDLINWTIQFVNSVKNSDEFFGKVLCPFIYLKAVCEKLLNINNSESIKKLKDIMQNDNNFNVLFGTKTMKFYFGRAEQVFLTDSYMKNSLKELITQTSKKDIHYKYLIRIYDEIFGGNDDE